MAIDKESRRAHRNHPHADLGGLVAIASAAPNWSTVYGTGVLTLMRLRNFLQKAWVRLVCVAREIGQRPLSLANALLIAVNRKGLGVLLTPRP
jgi:hypothetical protein